MRTAATLFIAACLLIGGSGAAPPTVIGVFEETAVVNQPHAGDIRIGFVRTPSGWVSANCGEQYVGAPALRITCPNLPAPPIAWTIYDAGKIVGDAATDGWLDTMSYAHAGALRIVGGRLPEAGERSVRYGGWTGAEVRKPLVASSVRVPPFADRWSQDDAHWNLLDAAWPLFRAAVPRVDFCTSGPDGDPVYHSRPVQRGDLVAKRGWQSSGGEMLVRVALDQEIGKDCEMQDAHEMWLFRGVDGVLRPLPGQIWEGLINFSAALSPVAFGDFNGDGGEEAMFQFAAYNRDGYILYYDHFRRFARIEWHYH